MRQHMPQKQIFSVAIVAMADEPDFDWSSHEKGYLLGSFYYGYAIMQIPMGIIVKKISPHVCYGIAVLVSAMLTLLTPIAAKYISILLTFRILIGIVQAAAVPAILSFMTQWAPPLERSRMSQICFSGAFIGTVLTLPLSGVIGKNWGWEWIFYVFAIAALLWCIVWGIYVRDSPEKDHYISEQELMYIKKGLGNVESEKKLPIPWVSVLFSIPVWSLAAANFAWGWGYSTILTQLPTFLKGKMDQI